MNLAEVVGWVVLVSLVAIPLSMYYWKKWDRPSRAAKREAERRHTEREVRMLFLEQEAKSREAERLQALSALKERREFAPVSLSDETISMAFSNLDGEKPAKSAEEIARTAAEIEILEAIPESVEVPDIEPAEDVQEVLEDQGPVALKVGIELPESEAKSPQISDEVEWPEWE